MRVLSINRNCHMPKGRDLLSKEEFKTLFREPVY